MYKITVYIEEVNKKEIKKEKRIKEQEQVPGSLIDFINQNYELTELNKRGIKGTDLFIHYKESVKSPMGRDTMYNYLSKNFKAIKYRKIMFFNLIKK